MYKGEIGKEVENTMYITRAHLISESCFTDIIFYVGQTIYLSSSELWRLLWSIHVCHLMLRYAVVLVL